jgi:hypothetical protein
MWWKLGTARFCRVRLLYPPERHPLSAFSFLLFFEVSLLVWPSAVQYDSMEGSGLELHTQICVV